jgi:hypothetical protein
VNAENVWRKSRRKQGGKAGTKFPFLPNKRKNLKNIVKGKVIAYASAAYNTVFPAVSDIMDIQGIFHVTQALLENHMHRSAFYTHRRHTSYMMQHFREPGSRTSANVSLYLIRQEKQERRKDQLLSRSKVVIVPCAYIIEKHKQKRKQELSFCFFAFGCMRMQKK